MNDLININYESADRPTVSGRDLHEALKVETAYKDWFPRMCKYGFTEGVDFNPLIFEQVLCKVLFFIFYSYKMLQELQKFGFLPVYRRLRVYRNYTEIQIPVTGITEIQIPVNNCNRFGQFEIKIPFPAPICNQKYFPRLSQSISSSSI